MTINVPSALKTNQSTINQILSTPTAQTLANAPRDVLPFATAMIGFAGGIVTAMFRTSTQAGVEKTKHDGDGNGGAPIRSR